VKQENEEDLKWFGSFTRRKGLSAIQRRTTMATKRNKKPSKKVKTLRTKPLSAKQAKGVRGGTTPGRTKWGDITLKKGLTSG
jgi:hypothetical protein